LNPFVPLVEGHTLAQAKFVELAGSDVECELAVDLLILNFLGQQR
jgi:hypothetical protein